MRIFWVCNGTIGWWWLRWFCNKIFYKMSHSRNLGNLRELLSMDLYKVEFDPMLCYQCPNSSFSSIESTQTIHFQEIHQTYHNFASNLTLPKNGSHDPFQTPSHQWNQRHSSRWGWQPTWLQLRSDWQLAWDCFLRSWKRGCFFLHLFWAWWYTYTKKYPWDLLPKHLIP